MKFERHHRFVAGRIEEEQKTKDGIIIPTRPRKRSYRARASLPPALAYARTKVTATKPIVDQTRSIYTQP